MFASRIIRHSIPRGFFDAARAWFDAWLDDVAIIHHSIARCFLDAERAWFNAWLDDVATVAFIILRPFVDHVLKRLQPLRS